jgi:UDP-3-O-[3-hydroxymyristoyl] glucosamine N-acyltransferase
MGMEISIGELAALLGAEIVGKSDIRINNFSKIEEGVPNTISFLANPKYERFIYATKASAVIVNSSFVPERPVDATLLKVPDAYAAFAKLLQFYEQLQLKTEYTVNSLAFIHPDAKVDDRCSIEAFAYVSENARIGENCIIKAHVFIGRNVKIGNNVVLHPGVKIYHNCEIGDNCIIHAGTVIGSDGFGFAPKTGGNYDKIPQLGNVIIEDDVEIGANCTIDRATIGSTLIKKGVKLDNLIQVAHNVQIGDHSVIAAQTGISGSTKIGKNCLIGGQVGFAGHIEIADGTKIGAQSGITNHIKTENSIMQGSPAFPIREFQKSNVVIKKLPELYKQILQMQREIDELKIKLNKIE